MEQPCLRLAHQRRPLVIDEKMNQPGTLRQHHAQGPLVIQIQPQVHRRQDLPGRSQQAGEPGLRDPHLTRSGKLVPLQHQRQRPVGIGNAEHQQRRPASRRPAERRLRHRPVGALPAARQGAGLDLQTPARPHCGEIRDLSYFFRNHGLQQGGRSIIAPPLILDFHFGAAGHRPFEADLPRSLRADQRDDPGHGSAGGADGARGLGVQPRDPDRQDFHRGIFDPVIERHRFQHLPLAQGHLVEDPGGHPRIEPVDRQAEVPIAAEQSERQRARPRRGAGGLAGEGPPVSLGNIPPAHRPHLQAAFRHHHHQAAFARGAAQADPRHLPSGKRPRRLPGQGDLKLMPAQQLAGQMQGQRAGPSGRAFTPMTQRATGDALDLQLVGQIHRQPEQAGPLDVHRQAQRHHQAVVPDRHHLRPLRPQFRFDLVHADHQRRLGGAVAVSLLHHRCGLGRQQGPPQVLDIGPRQSRSLRRDQPGVIREGDGERSHLPRRAGHAQRGEGQVHRQAPGRLLGLHREPERLFPRRVQRHAQLAGGRIEAPLRDRPLGHLADHPPLRHLQAHRADPPLGRPDHHPVAAAGQSRARQVKIRHLGEKPCLLATGIPLAGAGRDRHHLGRTQQNRGAARLRGAVRHLDPRRRSRGKLPARLVQRHRHPPHRGRPARQGPAVLRVGQRHLELRPPAEPSAGIRQQKVGVAPAVRPLDHPQPVASELAQHRRRDEQ